MITIELTDTQTRNVLEQFLKRLETSATPAIAHTAGNPADFRSTITRISKGKQFSSGDIAAANGMKPIAAGARLKALSREGLVKKLGGGEWKRL